MTERCILHSDINSCYASIEECYNPQLKGFPLVVGGDEEQRHGIVLAKNESAKTYGIKTGMTLFEARKRCPDLYVLPPRMDLYMHVSELANSIYSRYTDQHQSFGIDEQWLDITSSLGFFRKTGVEVAEDIRKTILKELGVTVSIGVSWNKTFAKLGSDYKKPNAITVIDHNAYETIVKPMSVDNLLMVGPNTQKKLSSKGILTIGQLAGASDESLLSLLGKNGLLLKDMALGNDESPVTDEGYTSPAKSVGNSCTACRDLTTDDDVRIMIYLLSESVAARLREQNIKGRVIEISLRDKDLISFTRQKKLGSKWDVKSPIPYHRLKTGAQSRVEEMGLNLIFSTCSTVEIAEYAYQLYLHNYVLDGSRMSQKPLRSIGVRVSDLTTEDDCEQITLFADPEEREKRKRLDDCVDDIRRRYGFFGLQRASMLTDKELTRVNAKDDHTVHPHSFS